MGEQMDEKSKNRICVGLLAHVDAYLDTFDLERTLQMLDYAILVISGADGVQGHTQTLGRLPGVLWYGKYRL